MVKKKENNSRYDSVANYFRKKRVEAGLTQTQVGEHLGFSSPQFISNWERGVCFPPRQLMPKLISLYSLNPEEVIELFLEAERKDLEKHIKIKAVKKG